jgi:DNA processing protein
MEFLRPPASSSSDRPTSVALHPCPFVEVEAPAELAAAGFPRLCASRALDWTRRPRIAIVGARAPRSESAAFAHDLAKNLAARGAIILSGGAVGIDAAAHRGALDADGITWSVMPCGPPLVFPHHNERLFRCVTEGGAIVWPFAESTKPERASFFARNRVLVLLADHVVVVQAGIPSGSLNAGTLARSHKKPLWVVCGGPLLRGFEGSLRLLDEGARVFTSESTFLRGVGLIGHELRRRAEPEAKAGQPLSSTEARVLRTLTREGKHLEDIAELAGIPPSTTLTVLLTLSLENVVVEDPQGYFRRSASG